MCSFRTCPTLAQKMFKISRLRLDRNVHGERRRVSKHESIHLSDTRNLFALLCGFCGHRGAHGFCRLEYDVERQPRRQPVLRQHVQRWLAMQHRLHPGGLGRPLRKLRGPLRQSELATRRAPVIGDEHRKQFRSPGLLPHLEHPGSHPDFAV